MRLRPYVTSVNSPSIVAEKSSWRVGESLSLPLVLAFKDLRDAVFPSLSTVDRFPVAVLTGISYSHLKVLCRW